MSTKIAVIAAVAALAIALGTPAAAQSTANVRFERGADHAVLHGTVSGNDYFDYLLRARAGQTMAVNLRVTGTNGDGNAYVNILPPGSDGLAIYNGSASSDGSGSVKLPDDGEYRIRVYLMGNGGEGQVLHVAFLRGRGEGHAQNARPGPVRVTPFPRAGVP
jgi:hypothetical protein